jgi:hypothetical protein
MAGLTLIPASLAAKLASIVVHADEWSSPDGHPFDASAMRSLIADREVVDWVNKLTKAGLAPAKRSP